MNKKFAIAILMLGLMLLPTSNNINVNSPEMVDSAFVRSDLSGVKVATFHGSNTEIHNACRVAMENMFRWMNATVDTITAQDIKDGVLYNYDILGVPPGTLAEYSVNLGSTGVQAIREYLRNGGSDVGISRGAQFACDNVIYLGATADHPLDLFNGTGRGPVDGITDQFMYTVNVNKSCPGIDLSSLPDSYTMMGWEAIFFIPDDGMPPLNIISKYSTLDEASMITYEYGNGCVFLSGVHPELEEDSDRDQSDYFDHHEDPETDWPLMLEVGTWLVETSTWDNASIPVTTTSTTTTTTTTTNGTIDPFPMEAILVAGGVGAVVVIIIIGVILKRKP